MEMQLSKILKKLMSDKDLKASQLSRATGVPAQTLHNWLSGQKPRDIDQVKMVAEHFQISLDYLLYGINEKIEKLSFEQYQNEINAGVFEVILKKIRY
jgi:transcriptional regulator with XRE-family HTH domain